MKQLKNIMLIEDDSEDQEFFMEALGEIKNATLYYIACNGKEALERLRATSSLPDFIFSDIEMPIMNGIECLAEMKQDPRTRHIPVIILSSSVAHSQVACTLGARAFIKKPNSFSMLRQQIEKMINQGPVFSELTPHRTLQSLCIAA